MNFIIYDMSEIIMGVVRIMTWIHCLIVLHIDIVVCSVYFSLLLCAFHIAADLSYVLGKEYFLNKTKV